MRGASNAPSSRSSFRTTGYTTIALRFPRSPSVPPRMKGLPESGRLTTLASSPTSAYEVPTFDVLRHEYIAGEVQTERLLLAPIDVFCLASDTYLTWPMFFDYDIDGQQLVESLKKLVEKYPLLCGRIVADEETRYVIEVDATKEGAHGFPFTELKSEMSIAEAVLNHSQLKVESANFPCFPEMPFYMESMDIDAALKGEEPLVKVKLTHFKDGCALNLTIEHLVVDGQRCLEILRDISRAYRGKGIPDRDHNRSYQWPDQLAKHYISLGEDVAKFPRKASAKKEKVAFLKFPSEICQTETLYFSRETLDEMKALTKPFLQGDDFVSSNDVLLAFFWMLSCEMVAEKHPISNGTDLGATNTIVSSAIEYVKNGVDLVPENYCGNAVLTQFVANTGIDFDGKSLAECLTLLAGVVRKTLGEVKRNPDVVAQGVLAYYYMVSSGVIPVPVEQFRGTLTNLVKTPVPEIDFGKGPPVLAHITLPMPLIGPLKAAGPAPGDNDGILVYGQFLGREIEMLKSSIVRKECAPGMKLLYSDFSVDELNTLLGLSS